MHPAPLCDNELRWTFPSPPHWKQAFGILVSIFAIVIAQSKAAFVVRKSRIAEGLPIA